jgi:hypothetical protein
LVFDKPRTRSSSSVVVVVFAPLKDREAQLRRFEADYEPPEDGPLLLGPNSYDNEDNDGTPLEERG